MTHMRTTVPARVALALAGVLSCTVWAEAGPPPAADVPQPADTQPVERGVVLDMPEGLAPALEEFPGLGKVDWTRGELIAVGESEIKDANPRTKVRAMRLARIRSYANAVRLTAQLRVDADQDLQKVANRHRQIDIRGFVHGFEMAKNEVVQAGGKTYYRATLRVPFYGIKGLCVTIHDFVCDRKLAPRLREQPWRRPESDLPPHLLPPIIVIDATGLGTQAAVYPKIQDNLGNALLSSVLREQAVTVNEGLVTYVTPVKKAEPAAPGAAVPAGDWLAQLRSSGREVIVIRLTGPVPPLVPIAAAAGIPGAEALGALAPRPRRRRRVAAKATAVAGENKANIVIDAATAKKLASNPETAKVLKSGRVYVVVDARKAAIEGRVPQADPPVRVAAVPAHTDR